MDAEAGVCMPGTKQCKGTSSTPQLCDSIGNWRDQPACQYACTEGTCTGTCAPGSKRCSANNSVETCSAQGLWAGPAACTNQTCVNGACVGSCAPGQTRCSSDGDTPMRCDVNGNWMRDVVLCRGNGSITCGGSAYCLAVVRRFDLVTRNPNHHVYTLYQGEIDDFGNYPTQWVPHAEVFRAYYPTTSPPSPDILAECPPSTVLVRRWHNATSGDYLFTANRAEEASAPSYGYAVEQNAFCLHTSQVSGTVPWRRFEAVTASDHLYTKASSVPGYTYKGITGYVFP